MHMKGRVRLPSRHAQKAPHRWGVLILSVVLGFLAFATVAPASYAYFTQQSVNTASVAGQLNIPAPTETTESDPNPTADTPSDPNAGEPINILLIGSDTRIGENAELGGLAGLEGMRGDTTMILHISADRSRIEVVSIPRDSEVRVSDCTLSDGSTVPGWTGKFNIAFANGGQDGSPSDGAACVMQTIYDQTGLTFGNANDGYLYVVADFAGFKNMVNAIDGVPMCIEHDVSSSKANLDLEAGPQVLYGDDALAYARARTGTGLGDGTDLMRIERQQELLTNLARKVLGMNLFADFGQLTDFISATGASLTMSPELADIGYLGSVAYSLRSFDTDNLTMVTVPWQYKGDGSGNVEWTYEADALWEALVNDEPIAPLFEDEPDTTTDDGSGTGTTTEPTVPAWEPEQRSTWWTESTGSTSGVFGEDYSEVPNVGRVAVDDGEAEVIVPAPDRESEDDILAGCVWDGM